MITELRTAVYNAIAAATGISDIFFGRAQQGKKNYIVFSDILTDDDRDTAQDYENTNFQISVYNETLATAESQEQDIRDYIKANGLAVTGFDVMGINRTTKQTLSVDEVWHKISQYYARLEKQ